MNSVGFKRKTYLEILESMRGSARQLYGENVNLSERSPLGMFLQVIAWEISEAWKAIEDSHYNSFSSYANESALDDAVSNFGRVRFGGTKATTKIKVTGNIGTTVPKGFLCNTKSKVMFKTIEEVTLSSEEALVNIESLEIGSNTNVPQGSITEIVNPIAGISSVVNLNDATGGSDIEDDDRLRLRNLEALREPTTGDNLAQYKLWAREVNGVGNIKVLSATPTKGFVTIVLTDTEGLPADSELLDEVFDYIEGLRPVNAGIEVIPAVSRVVPISLKVSVAEGFIIQDIKEDLIMLLTNYFKELALKDNYISHAQIGRQILAIKGVIDYADLKLDSKMTNIELDNNEVPILGLIDMELM